jgi:cytoskeletal protein CcmA (bactofilin family)
MNHFDEMTAFHYLEAQLDEAQVAAVRAHAAECSECRSLLTALENESKWLANSLTEKDPVPARFVLQASKARLPWGWITVLGMAAGGIYTLWNGIVEPVEQQLSQAGFTGGNVMTMLFFSGAFWKGWSSVLSFLEYFSIAAVAMLLVALMQRYWRRGATVSMVLAGLILMLISAAQPARAGEVFRAKPGQPNYLLPAGQTVNNDLFVFADATRIEGTVNGDLFVWSNTVEVAGHVTGDVIAWGNHVRITGQVDGNVRSMAGSVFISGKVAKNVSVWTGVMELSHSGEIDGSLLSGAGEVMVSGRIGRDFVGFEGSTTIDGNVGGNVQLRSGQLEIGQTANIAGYTKYEGDHPAVVEAGAKLGSPVQFTMRTHAPNYRSGRYYWHQAEFWGAAFLFGLVLLLLLPGFFAEGTRASQKFLPSLGIGAIVLIATPILAVIVCITIVGIGVGIAALLLYAIALYASQVFVATWVGGALLGPGEGTGAALGRLALGLVIVHGLEMLPQHIGVLIKLVVILWGMGAIAIACYRSVKPAATAVAATAV